MRRRTGLVSLAVAVVVTLAVGCASQPAPAATQAPKTPAGATEAAKVPVAGTQAPAAAGGSTAAAPAKSSGTLVMASEGSPPTFDPLAASDSRVDMTSINLYSALTQYKSGTNDLEKELAESYEAASDGKSYTFKLRKGVKFHDGSELKAADVKYTVDRMLALKTGVYRSLVQVTGAETPDDYTIVLKLSAPFPGLPQAMARLYILNSKVLKAQDKGGDWGQQWLATNEAGSGPYKLVSFQPEQQWTVEKFPDYFKGWQGNHVDRAIFRVIKEESTRRLALEKGDVDWALVGSADTWDSLKKVKGVQVNSDATLNQLYFAFNTKNQYLKDVRVRQSLALVYDYKGHVDKARNGHADVASGPLPKAIPLQDASIAPSETNIQKAKQLMADAGFPNGGFELSMAYQGTMPEEVAAVQIFQAGASQIGVTIKPMAMEWPAKVGAFGKQETSPAMGTEWVYPAYPDPDQFMFRLAHSTQAGNEGLNFAWYSNPRMDELLSAGQTELDAGKRATIYKEAQKIWVDDVPYANVVIGHALSAQRDYVKGYKWTSAHSLAPEVYPISLEGKPDK